MTRNDGLSSKRKSCKAEGSGMEVVYLYNAPLAELVDALDLGSSLRVRVRVSQGVPNNARLVELVDTPGLSPDASA